MTIYRLYYTNVQAFNSNGKQTISVLNPDNTNIVGSAGGDPDYYDYYTINSAYQCAGKNKIKGRETLETLIIHPFPTGKYFSL